MTGVPAFVFSCDVDGCGQTKVIQTKRGSGNPRFALVAEHEWSFTSAKIELREPMTIQIGGLTLTHKVVMVDLCASHARLRRRGTRLVLRKDLRVLSYITAEQEARYEYDGVILADGADLADEDINAEQLEAPRQDQEAETT